MPPSGDSDRGVTDSTALGTAGQWYDARCIECRRRHQLRAEEEEEDRQTDPQELEEHSVRSNSTASQHAYFCILKCSPAKHEKRDRQDRGRPSSRHRTTAQESTVVEPEVPDSLDDIAQGSLSGLEMSTENPTSRPYGSHQYPPVGVRNAPKLKSSVHSLRNRLKQSISNMSLRTAFRDDVQEDAEPNQGHRLQSSASKISLRTAFRKQQSPVDMERGDAKGLTSALSSMSLRRAFRRREHEFTELPEEDAEETVTPQRQKRLAMHGGMPTRGLGLREAISNISLRSSSTVTARLDAGSSKEPLPSPSQKNPIRAADPSMRSLTDSISSIASRVGFISPQPQRNDFRQAPGRRLVIDGQLPPRGQVLIPPIPESPRDDDGLMDTVGATLTTQQKDKYCDPETLAILTGASYTTSAEDYLGFQLDTNAPFARIFSKRRAGRYTDREDDGYRSQTSTSQQRTPSPVYSDRDDVSELRDSELFADFSSWSRRVSPITLAEDDAGDHAQETIVERYLRQTPRQQQKKTESPPSSLAGSAATPWTKSWSAGGSHLCVNHRPSVESSASSWAQGNANEFATFVDAAERDWL